jgi:hypothetical protein
VRQGRGMGHPVCSSSFYILLSMFLSFMPDGVSSSASPTEYGGGKTPAKRASSLNPTSSSTPKPKSSLGGSASASSSRAPSTSASASASRPNGKTGGSSSLSSMLHGNGKKRFRWTRRDSEEIPHWHRHPPWGYDVTQSHFTVSVSVSLPIKLPAALRLFIRGRFG